MKIIYILKVGFHQYPPCLAQLLYLDDLGVELEVYHGKNAPAVDRLLDGRGIKHHTLESDRETKDRVDSWRVFWSYTKEIRRIIKNIPQDSVLWFGNCESVMTVGDSIKSRRYVMSVLELYNQMAKNTLLLKKYIHQAEAVICCEKHRAAIMQVYFGLKTVPYVMSNKPYEFAQGEGELELAPEMAKRLEELKNKFVVLYQGIVTKDRPLDKVADALRRLNGDIWFVVLGEATLEYEEELLSRYEKTVFLGYIPSPQHLLVTQYANIGIANYDYSCLNNLFCAPNKIYEYAKFGIPILASENIGLTETVGDAGAAACVDFTDVEQIANGIQTIRSNYQQYSNNARRFYDGTDNRAVMEELIGRLKRKTDKCNTRT